MNKTAGTFRERNAVPINESAGEMPIRLVDGLDVIDNESARQPDDGFENVHLDLDDLNLHRRTRDNADAILSV